MPRFTLLLCLAASALFAETMQETALRISSEIQAKHMPYGTILNPLYAAANSDQLITYTRCGDSAIWTGHYLAAESFRYAVTKTPESLAAVRTALNGLKLLVDVTGSHNLLARCLVRTDSPYAFGPRQEEARHKEYPATLNGQSYVWIADTSRDQYMGAFFGLSVAYEHVADPQIRATISDLVTRMIDRLRDREWTVVMPDGGSSTVFWHRPDQQLAILQVGRQVNPAKYASAYERFDSLIEVGFPISLEVGEPHESYFKFNLAAITFYTLLRLEDPSSGRMASYRSAYRTLRQATSGHGNAFFNVIDRALQGASGPRDAETAELLSAWLLRPRRDDFVDLRGKYRSCGSNQACEVIPVQERVRTDFLWQRSPFQLSGGGDGKIEAPGIDFILPYWMGRFYGMDFSLTVVSAASGDTRLAPDSLATLYGVDLPANARVRIEDASGVSVVVTPFYASTRQLNFLIPAATRLGSARFSVLAQDNSVSQSSITSLERVAPSIFSANASGRGPAAATAIRIDANGQQQPVPVFTCSGPALCLTQKMDVRRDSPLYVTFYATGLRNRANLTVTVGSTQVPVLYAGPQSQFAGLDQVNFLIPGDFRDTGRKDVVITVDGIRSNPVQIEIE